MHTHAEYFMNLEGYGFRSHRWNAAPAVRAQSRRDKGVIEPGLHTNTLHPWMVLGKWRWGKKVRKRGLLEWGNAVLVDSPRGRGRGAQGDVAGFACSSSCLSSGSFIDPRGSELELFLSEST